jgi:hypothetical protein
VRVLASGLTRGLPAGLGLVALLGLVLRRARRRRRRCLPALLVVACCGGCIPQSALRGAEVLPPGLSDLVVGVAAGRDPVHDLDRVPPVPQASTSPRGAAPIIGLARGLGRGYDLQILAFPLGGRLDLRRALLEEHMGWPLSLTAGLAAGGLWDPGLEQRCAGTEGHEGQDGCFEGQRWGAFVEFPLTLSQRRGGLCWFVGAKLGILWLHDQTSYADRAGRFEAVELGKSTTRIIADLGIGTELRVGQGLTLVPELRLLSSANEARRLVFYVVPGLALRVLL